MVDAKLRNDVLALHRYGLGVRDISRRVGVSRNTVRAIIRRHEQEGESGRKIAEEKFSWDEIAGKVLEVYLGN